MSRDRPELCPETRHCRGHADQEIHSIRFGREFKAEKRSFTPHLTVARFEPPVALGEFLEDIGVGGEPFRVDRLVLYRSHLRRPAPVYEPIATFAFANAEGVESSGREGT